MEKLPEDVMIEKILLKLPANSLVNLRYVSKDLWRLITSPSFIKLHLHHSSSIAQLNNNNYHNLLLICSCDYVTDYVTYKPVFHNHACNFPIITNTSTSAAAAAVSIVPSPRPEIAEMHLPFESTEVRASCNGLLYLHENFISWMDGKTIDDISYYIWNPCTKEYKQLPPPPRPLLLDGVHVERFNLKSGWTRYSSSGFCGFGYDRNNDEYKILHYENRVDRNCIVHVDQHDVQLHMLQSISAILEFNLYTLGTNTWTRIVDNPYRSFYFTESSKRIGFLVNGALHWIMRHSLSELTSKGKIISFDIEKQVFREVQRPRYYSSKEEEDEEEDHYCESLQTLQECLCMCQIHLHDREVNKIDIWMLQDYDVMDSWTKLFRVVIPDKEFDYYHFRLLRYCENGEIVILRNAGDVIVYDPVNHKARCAKKINESIAKKWMYYMDYTESLVCLNSGTYTTDNGRKGHIDNTITNCIIDLTQHNPQKEGDSSNILNGKKRKRTRTEMEKLPEDVMIEKIPLKLPANSSSIAQLNNNYHNLLLICSCDYVTYKPVIHNHACNFPIITNTSTSSSAAAAVSIVPSPHPEIAEMHLPFESTEVRASCNGLLYLHQNFISWMDGKTIDDISYYIWNPCTKEYKQLPPPPPPLLLDGHEVELVGKFALSRYSYHASNGFCGFGYDRNNDEYKILHYESVDQNVILEHDQLYEESISSIIEFNLYTLGTNTWTRIADNPYRSFNFTESSKKIGFLVNGALHWIMSPSDIRSKGKIISFDIEKEVFQEVQKPRYYSSKEEEDEEEDDHYCESLQTLQECLCMCQIHLHDGGVNKIDIWMLQDYDVMDSWTKLFRVVISDKKFDYYHFRLLRYCENGEIVMLRNAGDVIVYDPVNHKARCAKKINESIAKKWMHYMDYTESLVCLNSGTYTTDNGRKRHIDNTITDCIIDRRQYNAQKRRRF